jgi:hypothetical protein
MSLLHKYSKSYQGYLRTSGTFLAKFIRVIYGLSGHIFSKSYQGYLRTSGTFFSKSYQGYLRTSGTFLAKVISVIYGLPRHFLENVIRVIYGLSGHFHKCITQSMIVECQLKISRHNSHKRTWGHHSQYDSFRTTLKKKVKRVDRQQFYWSGDEHLQQ